MSLMKVQPLAHNNVTQKLLKYILINQTLIVKTWRNRIYYYSSGSTFDKITTELKDWMHTHTPLDSDVSDEDEHECDYTGAPAEKLLKHVRLYAPRLFIC